MMIIKGLLGGLFQIALFAVLLFLPAGTWHWPRAILFLMVCPTGTGQLEGSSYGSN
jgi:hypothetical protein